MIRFASQNQRKSLSYKTFLQLTTRCKRPYPARNVGNHPPRSGVLRQRTAICFVLILPGTVCIASPADPAPLAAATSASAAGDAVSRFLVDKGLIGPTAQSGFVTQVRDKAADMVVTAMNFLGVRYTRGGSDAESGFDCSGFTRQVFETSLGLVLPRRADEQAKAAGLVTVKKDELQPGDLVFFNTLRRTFSHVGIYVGEGKFIHAPKPGGEVRVESMNFAYWAKRFTGARRAEPAMEQAAASSQPACTDHAANGNATRAVLTRGFAPAQPAAGRPAGTIRHGRQSHPPRRSPLRRQHAAGAVSGDARDRPARRQARPAAARPAHLGHRPLQLPLQLLHAEGSVRQAVRVSAAFVAAQFRGDHAQRQALRRGTACARFG